MITLARLTLVEWPDRSCAHIGPVFWKSSVVCVGTMPFNFGGPQRSRWQHLILLFFFAMPHASQTFSTLTYLYTGRNEIGNVETIFSRPCEP